MESSSCSRQPRPAESLALGTPSGGDEAETATALLLQKLHMQSRFVRDQIVGPYTVSFMPRVGPLCCEEHTARLPEA